MAAAPTEDDPSTAEPGGATDPDAGVDPTVFLRENLGRLVRFAAALCGNATDGEDLVATAVLASLPRWQAITGSHYGYLRQAVLNEHIGGVRKQIRRRRLEPVPVHPVEPDRSDRVNARITVGAALDAIPDLQRTVLVLRYFEDLPVAEVARVLGRPDGTIRRITHEGLTALRAQELFTHPGQES